MNDALRARVCETAHTYLRTPYHHHGLLKGIGADCATFPVMVFMELGLLTKEALAAEGSKTFELRDGVLTPVYSSQWFLHHGEEIYLADILRFADEIDGPPQPGDLALFKVGRLFAHGAIVIEWPLVIHAYKQYGMVALDDATNGEFADKKKHPSRFFSYRT